MERKYTAKVTFESNWVDNLNGVGLIVAPVEGVLTWVEDDDHGGPTPLSVKETNNDGADGLFTITKVTDIKEVSK